MPHQGRGHDIQHAADGWLNCSGGKMATAPIDAGIIDHDADGMSQIRPVGRESGRGKQ